MQSRSLLDTANARIHRKADESGKTWLARQQYFLNRVGSERRLLEAVLAGIRNRVGSERRLLEAVLAGIRAQRGIEPNAPNPRGRGFRRLAKEYPVRYLELVRDEEAAVDERQRRAKEERKRQRREQRR